MVRMDKRVWLIFGGLLLLFLSFAGNLTGIGDDYWFSHFQLDSNTIIERAARCKEEFTFDGPLLPKAEHADQMYNLNADCDMYEPYKSQLGLQAKLIAFFAPTNPAHLDAYFHGVGLVLAALAATLFMLLVLKVARLFGKWTGVTVFALVVLSPWVVVFAKNMYWVELTLFLPFAVSMLLYERYKDQGKLWLFYVILGLAFLLKFLNGYEYVTTIIISSIVPIVLYETIRKPRNIQRHWKKLIAVLSVSVIAFFIAIVANIASLTSYYHSWSKSAELVVQRAGDRLDITDKQQKVIYGMKRNTPGAYAFINNLYDIEVLKEGKGHPFKYAVLSAITYALLPAVSLPFVLSEPIGTILQSITAVSIIAYFMLRYMIRKKKVTRSLGVALQRVYWLSLVGGISWLLIMPGHAYPHTHINAIIFYMPFLLICYIIIGLFVDKGIIRRKR